MKAQVMKRAWEITKEAVKKFGGKVKEYFAQALKMAWAEIKKGAKKMEKIKEIIKKYNIDAEKKNGEYTGRIHIKNMVAVRKFGDSEFKENKAAILDYLKKEDERKEREYQERVAKINAIPGLKEIKEAMEDVERWHYEFERSFDGEYAVGGYGVRKKPEYDFKKMHEDYPVADAYLKAESMSKKSNYELRSIGEKALERIINGENYETVLADMAAEEKTFTVKHIWD